MKIETLLENLPQLEGSEKQIAWAEDIRKEFVEQATVYYNWILAKAKQEQKKFWQKAVKSKDLASTLQICTLKISLKL